MEFIAEPRIRLSDGAEQVIGSGPDWHGHSAPVRASGIYDGEEYNAAKEISGWSCPSLVYGPERGWLPVITTGRTTTELTERVNPPLTIHERLKPKRYLRTAKAEYSYITGDRPAIARPRFTFFGFRFVKVEGIEDKRLEDFTACAIYYDIERIGWIETSDPRLNRLVENTLWSQKDNFLGIPTDCPQRDKRMGWTGGGDIL
jgi:alpha-L-rhamnosidase